MSMEEKSSLDLSTQIREYVRKWKTFSHLRLKLRERGIKKIVIRYQTDPVVSILIAPLGKKGR